MLTALVISQSPPSLVCSGTTWYQKNYWNNFIIMWRGKQTSRRDKKEKKGGAVVHAIIVSGFLVCLLGLIALVIGHNTEHSGNISIVHGVLSLDKWEKFSL